MSSKTTTSGPLARERLEQLAGAPEELLDGELARRSEPDRRGDALDRRPRRPRRRASRACARAVAGASSSSIPAASRTISTQRPERDAARRTAGSGRGARAPSSATSGRTRATQPRLADARLADDRDQRGTRCGDARARAPRRGGAARASRPTSGASSAGATAAGRPRTASSRYAGTRSALPFSSSGSTASTSTRVAHEPVGRLADQDLDRGRGLLEPRGDVDGVAGDQPLAGGRVAGDHLAGVHAGPVRQPHAPARARARRSAARARRCISAAARTARSASSSWSVGQPEDGHDRVADVLLDRPAVPLQHRRASPRSSATAPRAATRSRVRSPRLVEPFRSEKTIVTVLRTSWAGSAAASGVPQKPHSRNRRGFSSPQLGQTATDRVYERRAREPCPCSIGSRREGGVVCHSAQGPVGRSRTCRARRRHPGDRLRRGRRRRRRLLGLAADPVAVAVDPVRIVPGDADGSLSHPPDGVTVETRSDRQAGAVAGHAVRPHQASRRGRSAWSSLEGGGRVEPRAAMPPRAPLVRFAFRAAASSSSA